ncbi:MAG: GerAB/ArcD/ProY family transporter, partial [Oscillospiraceae bacterium]
MTIKNNLNNKDIIAILILSKIFSFLTLTYNNNQNDNFYSSLMTMFLTSLFLLIIAFVLFKLNKTKDMDILSLLITKNNTLTFLNITFLILMSLIYFYNIFDTFIIFTTDVIYTKSDYIVLALLFLGIIFYTIYNGISSLSKCARVILFLFYIFIFFLFVMSFTKFNIGNVTSQPIKFNYNFNSTIDGFFNTFEFILIFFFLKHIKDEDKYNKKKITIYTNFVWVSFILTIILMIISTLSVGPFLKNSKYPIYILSMTTDISFIQRLDGFFILIWTFIAFVKLTAIAFLITDIFHERFNKYTKKITALPAFVIFIAIFVFKFIDITHLVYIYNVLFIYILV